MSTSQQTTDQQRDALNAAGVDRIFEDVMSGTVTDRPGLAACLDFIRPGDTLVVVALDRLGRSMLHVIEVIEDLTARGIVIRSLREGIDTSTATGKMIAGILVSLAEFERTLIKERADAAREAARLRGKPTGRPRALTDAQVQQAQTLRASGFGPTEIGHAPVSRNDWLRGCGCF